MTRKILLTSIIATTLILSVTSFAPQNAHAITTTISDQITCESIPGAS